MGNIELHLNHSVFLREIMSSAAYEEGEISRKKGERVQLENWIFKKHKEQEFCIVVNLFDFTKEVHRE